MGTVASGSARQMRAIVPQTSIVWEAPYVMSATSGTVIVSNRNFKALVFSSTGGAAYTTAGGARYIFINCRFESPTQCIYSLHDIGVEFYNCVFYCTNPNVAGEYNPGCIIGAFNRFIVRNCTLVGGGMRLSTVNVTYLDVRFNQGRNIQSRRSDGAGGYQNANVTRQFLQFNGITIGDGVTEPLVEWNDIWNKAYESCVGGDVISFHGARAVAGAYLRLRFNLLWGNYSYDPLTVANSGRGIMVEAGSGDGWLDITDNMGAALTGMVVLNTDGDYNEINVKRNSVVFSNKLGGSTIAGGVEYPFVAKTGNTGQNQVWDANSWQYNSLNYDALNTGAKPPEGPFSQNYTLPGNSLGTNWNKISPVATEADEAAVRTAYLAAAAAAGKVLGSNIPQWW